MVKHTKFRKKFIFVQQRDMKMITHKLDKNRINAHASYFTLTNYY